MFEQAVLESPGAHRRSRTTVAALVVQCLAVAWVVIVPLLLIEAPPRFRFAFTGINFSPPPPPVPASGELQASHTGHSQVVGTTVMLPRVIPREAAKIHDDNVQPPSALGAGPGVEGGTGSDVAHNVTELFTTPTIPLPKAPVPGRPVSVSTGVMQGLLLSGPKPAYPAVAQAAPIQGAVVLSATINREGLIENLRVISGHPMLAGAAVEAVRQWRYRPYQLNGKPVEVETQITVNFTLSGG